MNGKIEMNYEYSYTSDKYITICATKKGFTADTLGDICQKGLRKIEMMMELATNAIVPIMPNSFQKKATNQAKEKHLTSKYASAIVQYMMATTSQQNKI